METESFLKHVITTPSGWFNLAFKPASDDEWTSEWYEWPSQMHDIVGHATQLASKNNVYFSAHLFNAKKALKANVLPSRTIQADLDNALIPTVNQPTVLVETSPQRHQGFWILEAAPTPHELETLSRSLTYDIIDSDHSGWSLGHKMRVPNTYNFKYATGPKQVRVISAILNTYKTLKFNSADIELQEHIDDEVDIDIATFKPPSEGPRQLWAKYRSKVPRAVSNKYDIAQPDRSAAIWGLELALFRVGLSRDEVFWICRESANNKFRDNKYHADLDLWKDVLRAERNLRTPVQDEDIKLRINEARRLPGLASDRRLYIAGIVRDHMMQNGSFVATTDNQEWYVREDNGRPINLGFHNEFMASLLEIRYGLSAVETEQRYTIGNLRTMTRERGQHGEVGVLSHFDRKNRALLVHQGRKDVAYVTETSVSTINNGNLGVVFPWISDQAPFDPIPTDPSFLDNLFQGCFDNLEDLAPQHALALLKAWLMFLIFRGDARSRPLLVFLGQPGCLSGETTLEVKRGHKGTDSQHTRSFSLAEIYNSFNGYAVGKGRRAWNRAIPTHLRSVKNGAIEWLPIKNVVKSGRKITYSVVVGNKAPFRATEDHRFLTPTGYKALKDLTIGEKVTTKGRVPFLGRINYTRRTIAANKHPYAWQKIIAGRTYGSILFCRAVLEANLNSLSIKDYLGIVHKGREGIEDLKFLPKDINIHHKDENPENDSLENLEALTKLEHDRITAIQQNELRNGHWLTEEEPIRSIELFGEEETYDIEMEDSSAPNFLVNGVAVHNSGKTTLFNRIYAMLYGSEKHITKVSTAENYDHAVSHDPFVVFDDVDGYYPWLPDSLALSAGNNDLKRRKLYTDNDEITLKLQALVGITAHNPKFLREDVVDRMIILNFHRLEAHHSETPIIDRVIRERDKLWGSLLNGAQAMLQTPMPLETEVPVFRVNDFARIGLWAARSLGFEKDFREALAGNKEEQVALNLSEEGMLIDTLNRWLARPKPAWYNPAELWEDLILVTSDETNFRRLYKNSVVLGKKLMTLEDTLRSMFKVEIEATEIGIHKWRLSKK